MMHFLHGHNSSKCMHRSFEVSTSMVNELFLDRNAKHWIASLHPFQSTLSLEEVTL